MNDDKFHLSKLDIHTEADFHKWIQKAGRLITCSWFVGCIRHRSDGRWVPVAMFADETHGQFAYAFEIRGGEPEISALCKRLRDVQTRCTELNG